MYFVCDSFNFHGTAIVFKIFGCYTVHINVQKKKKLGIKETRQNLDFISVLQVGDVNKDIPKPPSGFPKCNDFK